MSTERPRMNQSSSKREGPSMSKEASAEPELPRGGAVDEHEEVIGEPELLQRGAVDEHEEAIDDQRSFNGELPMSTKSHRRTRAPQTGSRR